MNKKITVLILVTVIVFSLATPILADFDESGGHLRIKPYRNPSKIKFTGNSGTSYEVIVASGIVGYNHITVGNKVKVCQAYTQITGANPGAIDGIWGNQSESALRTAQTTMHDYGYTLVTSDGVCGQYTWRGFFSYHYVSIFNPIPSSLKNLL